MTLQIFATRFDPQLLGALYHRAPDTLREEAAFTELAKFVSDHAVKYLTTEFKCVRVDVSRADEPDEQDAPLLSDLIKQFQARAA